MSIPVQCPACSFQTRVKSKYAGKRVRCPQCRSRIEVPLASDSQVAPDNESGVDPVGFFQVEQQKPRVVGPSLPPPVVAPLTPPVAGPIPPAVAKPAFIVPQESWPAWLLFCAGGLGTLLVVAILMAAYLLVGKSLRATPNPPAPRVALVDEEPVRNSPQAFPIQQPPQDKKSPDSSAAPQADVPEIVPLDPPAPAEQAALPDAPVAAPKADQEPPPQSPGPEAEPQDSSAAGPGAVAAEESNAAAEEDVNAAAETRTKPEPPTTVAFESLLLESPATSMAMTEDGRYLAISHQADNQLTVYDVFDSKIATSIATVAPRCILCRDNKLFVSNHGQGTISVFEQGGDWRQVNELKAGKPNVVHISAPGGQNYRGELVVTCHGPGRQASYQDSHVFVVDAKADTCRLLSHAPEATVSYDGQIVMTQGSFQLSPSGDMTAFRYSEYLSAQGKPEPVFRGGISQTPFVYQVSSGSFWISANAVFAGVPITQLEKDLGMLIVPDVSQKLLYSLTDGLLTAHRLDLKLTDIGQRTVTYPIPSKDFHKVYRHLYRTRDYYLDHPVACTHQDRLFLFVLTGEGGMVLAADTAAFSPHGASSSSSDQGVAVTSPEAESSDDTDHGAGSTWTDSLAKGFPSRIVAGQLFQFQLTVSKEMSVALMSQLPGVSLTPEGDFRWTPSADQVGVHELKIRVKQGGEVTFVRPKLEVVDQDLAASVGGDLAKLDKVAKVDLVVDRFAISNSYDREQMLLLQGNSLRILADDGITVTEIRTLPNSYEFIEERADVYLGVVRGGNPALQIIDKRKMKVRREIPLATDELQVLEVTDLAISPTSAKSFVAIKHAMELPRYTVLTVDEATGRVQAPGILGTWVEVSPDGKRLYTGYKDLYERGSSFHINPDWRLIEIPEYGHVDLLLSWNIGSRIRLREVVRQAGGNGKGIRMSADGQRLTYLSFVGTPMHSKNLKGWRTDSLSAPGVVYETKDRAVTTELAFHPLLPIVAVPGSGSAVLFHRETGKLLENKLLLREGGLGDVTVEQLFFSPSGRNLVFVCSDPTGRYLRAVPLKLTLQELAHRAKPQPPTPEVEPKAKTVPRPQLEALNPHDAKSTFTARDIGKKYLDAVVSVLTDVTSGTGFFIGSTGYVLTSAHVVDAADSIEVVYNSTPGAEEFAPLRTPAQIIRIDPALDVALLKIEPSRDLVHVHFSPDDRVDTGESVTVIGDPGLGDQILNRTMTTGIVSNPQREIEGQRYIQISAAINPGNSGGPLFNEHGCVIGLISLKGNIEGAGFALPVGPLKTFLQQAVDGK